MSSRNTVMCAALLGLLLAACDDPAGPGRSVACRAEGTTHSGTIEGAETWTAAAGPHHVVDTVHVGSHEATGTLTIEPGALVCFADGAVLAVEPAAASVGVSRLIAAGTAGSVITFTAADPSRRWGGITIGTLSVTGASRISWAVIEGATSGVRALGAVDIDNTVFRDVSGAAVFFSYYNAGGRLTDSVVDSAGSGSVAAIVLEAGTLENVEIRRAVSNGVFIRARRSTVTVDGCSITDSGGHGVHVDASTVHPLEIHGCDFERNGGSGIENASDVIVDARDNWWGDPAGPEGAAGDGVSDGVEYTPFRVTARSAKTRSSP